ncbi:MAG: Asp-tRNA(Asn)/Glu-tRNA(Gln) amidotransferase subunit GatB [Cyclobacteriaceae bacterium]
MGEPELVVGLEVHAQLLTNSKIFSSDAVTFGDDPNTHAGFITLAHPGTLPKMNSKVVELAVRMGLACHCRISPTVSFDRKNYVYPDLPKGYQITQDKNPICRNGFVETEDGKKIHLNRIHLEEDAGKSIHDADQTMTCLDFNRAGTPLIEIVTEPCIHSSEDAARFMTEVRSMLKFLKICDGNMEEGSLRADANVSVRFRGDQGLGKKVEIKNMNSIRNLRDAIDYEFRRQSEMLIQGIPVTSETRLYNADTGTTFPMREKEVLNDYRYFPEPDLSVMVLEEEFIESVRLSMPKTSAAFQEIIINNFDLPEYDARVLSADKRTAEFFIDVCKHTVHFKQASNWVMGPVRNLMNLNSDADIPVHSEKLAELINLIQEGKLGHTNAVQKIFPLMAENPDEWPAQIANRTGLQQTADEGELRRIIKDVIRIYPLKVEEFKKGKKGIIAMFMGEVMKRTKGTADPKRANEILSEEINKSN